MPDDPQNTTLHDFLTDAHRLLGRAQECLQHLQLIGADADASTCLVLTLEQLAIEAQRHKQAEIGGFCAQLQQRIEPEPCRNRLHEDALPLLHASLELLAWQLELIDPRTGTLSMDNHEQLQLLEALGQTLAPWAGTAAYRAHNNAPARTH